MPLIPFFKRKPAKLRYKVKYKNPGHEGVDLLVTLHGPDPRELLRRCATSVIQVLYHDVPESLQPRVKSITLILRSMPGVAHTCGTEEHKEIHFSLEYIKSLSPALAQSEVEGVLVHEMVHCFQYNAHNTCPPGLIEGLADFVRLRAGFAPPHWTRNRVDTWDAGYERTGYFLDWIEQQHSSPGRSFVRDLNLAMKDRNFDETMFKDLTGLSLSELWDLYCNDPEGN